MSKNLTTGVTPELNGSGQRIALICARWNDVIVNRLENGAREALVNAGVAEGDIVSIKVPGALEIPIAMKAALATGAFDAAIALGVVLRGDTYHFEVVSNESASGVMRVGLDSGRVVANGILTSIPKPKPTSALLTARETKVRKPPLPPSNFLRSASNWLRNNFPHRHEDVIVGWRAT